MNEIVSFAEHIRDISWRHRVGLLVGSALTSWLIMHDTAACDPVPARTQGPAVYAPQYQGVDINNPAVYPRI